MNATAGVAGTFVYTPRAATVLNAGTGQTLSVDFTPTDGANYTTRRRRRSQITVLKATPVITWPTPASITYGTALSATQLNATTPVRRARSPTRRRSGRSSLRAPAQTLSVTFTPTDAANYTGATKSVAIDVSRRRRR